MQLASVLLGGAGLILAPVAGATQRRDGNPVSELQQCRSIDEDKRRLACFDRTTATLAESQEAGEIVVLNREAVKKQRQKRFGLGGAAALGAADVTGATVKEVNSTIRAVVNARVPLRYDLELADGSVWQTIDPVRFLKPGAPIKIVAASLGGFRASVAEGRSFLIKRLR